MGKPTSNTFTAFFAFAALLAIVQSFNAFGQEGHPLKGSWIGTWASNETHGESVLLVLDWDGRNIIGVINPGTDDMAITKASLDPTGWVVRLEADAKDKAGAPVHYVIEGRIEDLELPNRSIVGTWKHQRGHGDFQAARQ
ncbi:MAG TPA: hypothetical protein VJA26_01875 [Gammaproteobacteria bacterium]|nr:hypothetical protein [Gammaproteobacteria bacterium]